MKTNLSRIVLAAAFLLLGLFFTYRTWSVSSPGQLWRPGDWWLVRVERPQSFLEEASPPWREVNRIRFEVTGSSQGLAGSRVDLRLTFSPAVLGGYTVLELAYDSQTLAVVEGRMTGRGLPDLDWSTARPLLEASLVPLDGMRWRRASLEQVRHEVPESERVLSAYRVELGKAQYDWSTEAPWWLSYAVGDEVRAELLDCSTWHPGAAELQAVLPIPEEPAVAEEALEQARWSLDYTLSLKTNDGSETIVASRQGRVSSERGLGTQVLSLNWGAPAQKVYVYISVHTGSSPEAVLDKVVVSEPVYAVQAIGVRAAFSEGSALLTTPIIVGGRSYILQVDCALH